MERILYWLYKIFHVVVLNFNFLSIRLRDSYFQWGFAEVYSHYLSVCFVWFRNALIYLKKFCFMVKNIIASQLLNEFYCSGSTAWIFGKRTFTCFKLGICPELHWKFQNQTILLREYSTAFIWASSLLYHFIYIHVAILLIIDINYTLLNYLLYIVQFYILVSKKSKD